MRCVVVDAPLLDGERPPECPFEAAIAAGTRGNRTPRAHLRRRIPPRLERFFVGQHRSRAARLAPVLESLFVHGGESSSDVRQAPLRCIEFSQGCSGNPRVPSVAEQGNFLNARWAVYLSSGGAFSERRNGSVTALGVVAPARVRKTLGSSCGVENSWLAFYWNGAKALEPRSVQVARIHRFSRRWAVVPIRHPR